MNEIETKQSLINKYFWYIVFSVAFLGCIALLERFYGKSAMSAVFNIRPLHFVILLFAAYRITRLFVADHITEWIRDLFVSVSEEKELSTGSLRIVRTKHTKGFRKTVSDVLGCHWCAGVWGALLTVFLYMTVFKFSFFPAWVLLIIFAVAGGASVLQVIIIALTAQRVAPTDPSLLKSKDTTQVATTPNVCTECGLD